MNSNAPIYSKQVIEIADYLFANPQLKTAEIIAEFCVRLRKSKRTIESWLKKAREYNKERIFRQEKARDEVLIKQTKDAVKSQIRTRNELLGKYWKIIDNYFDVTEKRKKAMKIGNMIILPTAQDVLRSGSQISKIEGWFADENKPAEEHNQKPVIMQLADGVEIEI